MKQYDVIVIGSGGGSKITRPAANLGHKVAIIEKGFLGGTCLNHGCIPSKMLIHPADMLSVLRDMRRFEFEPIPIPKVDYASLVRRVTETVERDSNSIGPVYEKHENIDYFSGEAKFIGPKQVRVNNEVLTADKIFLPVGARAHVPDLEGLEGTPYLTYKEVLRLEKLPSSITVIGGGYIATELGYFLGMMGANVTFVVRSQFLRHEDQGISQVFHDVFSKKFNTVLGTPEKVSYTDDIFSLEVKTSTGCQTLLSEQLLVATGFTPNADRLNLDATHVDVDEKGYINVNDRLETSMPGIWAFGDVIGRYFFRHTVNYEGEYLFRTVFQGLDKGSLVYPPVPHAVFTNPQVAGVGVREQDMDSASIFIGENSYAKSAMGMALLSEHGVCKLIFDKATLKLIGAHILGDEAATMSHMLIAYIKMGATLNDMLDTIYIHPALPEIIRNAARNALIVYHKSLKPVISG